MLLELTYPRPLTTPYGKADAHWLIDYGPDVDLIWVCIQRNGERKGQCWCWSNRQVLFDDNITTVRGLA